MKIDFDKLWNFSKPAETEVKFREVLEQSLTEDVDYILQLKTQIARTQGLQRKFDDAHKTLDQVKAQLSGEFEVAEIRYNLERGRVFNSSKLKTEALPYFLKAFALAVTSAQDNYAVDAAHMVAITEIEAEKQMKWNLTALDLAESSKDEKARSWLGSLYNNIGWAYHDTKKFTDALDIFKKALAFRESKGEPGSIRIAKWAIARTHRSLNNLDEALKIQKALEHEFSQGPQQDGYVFEELGELHLLLNQKLESQKYFGLAYAELIKDDWFKSNEAVRLARLKELS